MLFPVVHYRSFMGERRPAMLPHIVQVRSAESADILWSILKHCIVTGDEVEAPAAQLSRIVQL